MHVIEWILALLICMCWKQAHSQTVQEVSSKTGLYFDEMGTVLFYPIRWKVVTYTDLEPTLELWKQTKTHQRKILEFCKKVKSKNWYHYTDCISFDQYTKSKNKYIDGLKDLVAEYLTTDIQNSNHRTKRGVLNFIGDI
jgi:hypothetical protein